MIPQKLAQLLDAAAAASDWLDYERPLFELLEHAIGFDVAFCIRGDGLGPHAPGFDRRVRRQTDGCMDKYAHEYAALKHCALQQGGVAIDVDFFGRAGLERTHAYRDMIRPHGGRSSLLLFMGTSTQPVATLVLGRTRGEFTARHCEELAAARSLLTVCEQALASRLPATSATPALSPRERELVHYLRLGYTNHEIGLACGTSFRTVRNQLSHLFDKLEVSTRSEAVARSFELALPLG